MACSSKIWENSVSCTTLYTILNEFSENVHRDCLVVSGKLLKLMIEKNKILQNNCSCVVILLKIYVTAYSDINHSLADYRIVENLKRLLDIYCITPSQTTDDSIKSSLLAIVSLVLTIISSYKSSDDDKKELNEMHNHILRSVEATAKDCDGSDKLIFKLEILTLIYQKFSIFTFGFGEKTKYENDLKIQMSVLFTNLILYSYETKVAVQTVIYLIPAFIKFTGCGQVLEAFWMQISDCLSKSSSLKLQRVLMMMCKYFDICFNGSQFKDSGLVVIKDPNFWYLIIKLVLVNKEPVIRKQGQYLLREAVNQINNFKLFTEIQSKNNFFFNSGLQPEIVAVYNKIIIVLEFLEEQQFHIIEPIFEDINYLVDLIIDLEILDLCLVLLIYKRLLMHESTQVVKWGLSSFLKLPDEFFSKEYIAKESTLLLAWNLKNPNLYYSNHLTFSKELNEFFQRITTLSSSKTFFTLLFKGICSNVWSAETLFFLMDSLSGIKKFSLWGKNEISEAKTFVSKAFQTHDVAIRIGTQYKLLCAVSNLTDEKDVRLEDVVVFISSFSTKEVVKVGSRAWNVLTEWLGSSYSREEFQNVFERYKIGELQNEFNEKCVALMLILYYCIHELDVEDSLATSYFREMLASFSAIHKRPYCDKSLHEKYLSTIMYIYEISDASPNFKRACLPFVRDIILYTQTRLHQISNLQDFHTCQLYLSAFEIIIKNLIVFRVDPEDVNDLYEEISRELESGFPSISGVGLYWRVKILRVIFTSYNFEPKASFLQFLLSSLNECLTKGDDYSETPTDLQRLWGVINSEFLSEKWKILNHLVDSKLVLLSPAGIDRIMINSSSDVDLFDFCKEALLKAPNIFNSVMSFFKNALVVMQIGPKCQNFVCDSLFDMLLFSSGENVVLMQQFIKIFFQEYLITSQEKEVQETLWKVTCFILSLELNTVNIFMKHIQKLKIHKSVLFFCKILAKGLIFDFSLEKNFRLIYKVYSHLEASKICHPGEINGCIFENEICARSVEMILRLDRNSSNDQNFARNLVKTLLKTGNLMGDFKSNVHKSNRVRLRQTQAFLLLEPMLCPDEDLAKEVYNWLFKCLTTENLQPGVRCLQEWLLIRILLRHPELYSEFRTLNYLKDSTETGKKALCSLIAVSFHLCSLISSNETEKIIQNDIGTILSFCFHQNFEVRLYALVVFQKLYKLAQSRKLDELTVKYEMIYSSISECFERSLKGNVSKNVAKLMDDFFFKKFNPIDHYSLQSIYLDLPMLTNVNPYEFISNEIFQYCGVEFDKLDLFSKNPTTLLNDANETISSTEDLKFDLPENNNSFDLTDPNWKKIENKIVYHQKKMIPVNSLFPDWNDESQDIAKQNGLIVVASLVDRIPNLGGLARSCEVFGASKLVVHSYKQVQDKQFTNLSVTAEKWITIKEVRIDMLFDYLIRMKRNGYSLIGAEQAVNSVSLGSIKFPKLSVLLLGNERKGIPPNLLPLLDVCVEIPQLGKIRSLNVHVAGALFMWEYAKQNKF